MFLQAESPADCRPHPERTVEFETNPALLDAAWKAGESWREAEMALARALAAIENARCYVEMGCSSTAQWAARMGLAAEDTRRLVRLGQALTVQPSLEERVRERALSTSAAAAIAPILSAQKAADELPLWGSPWSQRAERVSLSRLRRDVRAEMAQRRAGTSVVRVDLLVTENAREDLERARVVASRKEGRFLTRDETLGVVLDHYLTEFDPLRGTEGTRRVGPTVDRPEDRYIPVAVRRAIRRRAEDRCEFPYCEENIDLEFAHRKPHRHGSGREESDLFLLCWLHHNMFDSGMLQVIGTSADPVWVDTFGILYTRNDRGGRGPQNEAEWQAARAMQERTGHGTPWPRQASSQDGTDRRGGEPESFSCASLAAARAAGGGADPGAGALGDPMIHASACAPRAPPGRRDAM